jgi:hypothetical protein
MTMPGDQSCPPLLQTQLMQRIRVLEAESTVSQ